MYLWIHSVFHQLATLMMIWNIWYLTVLLCLTSIFVLFLTVPSWKYFPLSFTVNFIFCRIIWNTCMSYFLFPLKLTTMFGTAILSQETTNFSVSSYQKHYGSGVNKNKNQQILVLFWFVCPISWYVTERIVASGNETGGKMESLKYACSHLVYCHYHYQKLFLNPYM